MRIGGFQKLSLVDFPGMVAATIFTQGCNFRCSYCHNPQLVLPQSFQVPLAPEKVLDYLKERRGKIEGIVISGGEPTIQAGLIDFIVNIKIMGFALKLDTNGSHPEVLSALFDLKLLDYVAMDIKTTFEKYDKLVGSACDISKFKESIHLIVNSNIPYQFRTTLVKEFCLDKDLDGIQLMIKGADHYVLQPFVFTQQMVNHQLVFQEQYTNTQTELLKEKYELKGKV